MLKAGPPDVASIAELAQTAGRSRMPAVGGSRKIMDQRAAPPGLPCSCAHISRRQTCRVDDRAVPVVRLRCAYRSRRQRRLPSWNANARGPYVALTAHLDTVLAPRTPEDIKINPTGRCSVPVYRTTAPVWPRLLAIARAMKASPRVEYTEFRCCSSPMSAKRAKATSAACAIYAASLAGIEDPGLHRAGRADDRPHHLSGARKPAV